MAAVLKKFLAVILVGKSGSVYRECMLFFVRLAALYKNSSSAKFGAGRDDGDGLLHSLHIRVI
jgi:hypothetical protein